MDFLAPNILGRCGREFPGRWARSPQYLANDAGHAEGRDP